MKQTPRKRKPKTLGQSPKLKAKKTKLDDILYENSELHPLLDKLLPKLPRVSGVEYKQGPNEKGADFVFNLADPDLGFDEVVGVVAKVGGIHQNMDEIERQIDECFTLPRYMESGKKEVYVDKVWVIFTGSTTPVAELKINKKFRSHSIKFLPGKKLEELIDKFLPFYWDEVPVHIGNYLNTVTKEMIDIENRVSLLNVTSKDIYVEPDITTYPRNEYDQKVRRVTQKSDKVDLLSEIKRRRLVFLEGDMGVGKSKVLRKISVQLATPGSFNETRILPVPVTFRELLSESDGDVLKLIEGRVSEDVRKDVDANGSYLLLVDGMDEKELTAGEQFECLQNIADKVLGHPNIKLILTSRPLHGFDDSAKGNSKFEVLKLKALSFSKSIQLVKEIFTELNVASRIVEDLKRSVLFRELPKNPIAVILLATLLKENKEEVPSNLTELYSKYTEVSLGRWDLNKGLSRQKEYETILRVLMALSTFIIDNDLRFVSVGEVKDFFARYLSERNLDLKEDVLFDLLMNRTDLMFFNTARTAVAFRHRTFAEYFYAKNSNETGTIQMGEKAFEAYWSNIYFFYFGITKDNLSGLEQLIDLSLPDQASRFIRIMNFGGLMLAAYLSPYKIVEASISKVAIEAAELYLEILDDPNDTPFVDMTRLHVLWTFQYVMRKSYAYSYFVPAMETAALEIAESSISEETKAYALFFLNMVYIEVTKDRSFAWLLEHVSNIPADLALGYRLETKDVKVRTDLMRRTDRRISRYFKGNRLAAKYAEQIYTKPIRSEK